MGQMGKSILLVDDDQEIRELLDAYLRRAGFTVRAVADGQSLRLALQDEPADLLILDVMLPDEDGFSLCRWVRALPNERAHTPIIMLTASSDEADRVIGLELGADDYLGKPFSPRELQARVKALLRRASFGEARSGHMVAFDEWRLDTVSHRLFHQDGEEVVLSGADFALLKLFLDHPQQILDRDTIANATRGREVMPLDRIVDMGVSRLRQRLRDTGKSPRLIRTVRGSGYLLAAQVHGPMADVF
ncbi:DNA-binding response OmpR family regulator [Pseudomonas duriflava]|uniref:DNA-binding response OmpR family regulator n=1 Tax=Pseudomonas duriflava TaxID=459528 RepID=A0A562Q7S4_9PSED|nr:response regulator [Pseudomonas duriflava]TWI52811.1 DNA-binding response OmpR family regulator [Pseudomonas duriflava]